jgi:hypothetical protein
VVGPAERTATAKRRRARLLVAVTVAVFAAMVFGLVGVHVILAQNQLRLDRLNAEAAADQVSYERLRLQVAQLESPARIVQDANNLGMVMPPGVTYLMPPTPATPQASPSGPAATTTAPATSSDWPEVKPELAARP